jgi:predicted glycosyltransferase
MGKIGKSLISKLLRLIVHDIKLFFYCLKNRPNLIIGIVAIRGSHVGWLLGIKTLVFTDSEHAKMQIALFKPFAHQIHTPHWFTKELGPKQIKYHGFHELAYLHPNHFKPRMDVLDKLGVNENEKYFIVRFVAWDATHDINQSGLSLDGKRTIIELLQQHGRVFVTSEYPLEPEFKSLEFNIPSSYLHDAIYFASIVIGEGATTACEAAVLGIPSIYVNSIDLGYITYLESDFDLVYHIKDEVQVVLKLEELLNKDDLRKEWETKKKLFLTKQIDTTEYMVSLVNNNS